jgi:hypothetical protein
MPWFCEDDGSLRYSSMQSGDALLRVQEVVSTADEALKYVERRTEMGDPLEQIEADIQPALLAKRILGSLRDEDKPLLLDAIEIIRRAVQDDGDQVEHLYARFELHTFIWELIRRLSSKEGSLDEVLPVYRKTVDRVLKWVSEGRTSYGKIKRRYYVAALLPGERRMAAGYPHDFLSGEIVWEVAARMIENPDQVKDHP